MFSIRTFVHAVASLVCALGVAVAPRDHAAADAGTVKVHASPKPLSSAAGTQDWNAFLGPSHNGVSTETHLIKRWGAHGPPLVWEMEAGSGYASPSVARGRLVFLDRVGDVERVECLDAETGKHHWTYEYPTHYVDRYDFNNGPRASPIIDGQRVYTYGAEGKLHCLDLETGHVLWAFDTSSRFKVHQDFFGVGSTPLIEGDLLVVNVGAPGGPEIVGFDKTDGTIRWQVGDKWTAGYASPIPADLSGKRRVLILCGGDSDPPRGGLLSLDPAGGEIEMRFPFRSKTYTSVNASTPVFAGGRVFISSSYHTGGVALDLKPDGSYAEAWRTRELGAHFTTPIVRDGFLYGIDGARENDTAIVCLDWKSGEKKWRSAPTWPEEFTHNGATQVTRIGVFRGSLLLADGRFWILGERGHLIQADLSPSGYREIQRTRLFNARETWTPPVLSRGLLYIRQNKPDQSNGKPPRLLCYDLRGD